MRIFVPLAAVSLALGACQPQASWERDLREHVKARTEAPLVEQAPPLDQIKLEKGPDGLFHEVGQTRPFTGTDVEPGSKGEDGDDTSDMTVVTPYRDGRIDGTRTTFFPSGGPREKRVYAAGLPQDSTLFYSPAKGGGRKVFFKLNAQDQHAGPMTRWHANGRTAIEAVLDENGQRHGESKEYAEDGSLVAHYRWEHGKLVGVLFETPAQKAAREKQEAQSKPSD